MAVTMRKMLFGKDLMESGNPARLILAKKTQMRIRFNLIFFIMVMAYGISGCKSSLVSRLFPEQTWSQNYALLEGTTCTSPEMIDGDLDTVGRRWKEIILTLPERKAIHRIVIRGTNFEDIIVYAGLGNADSCRSIKKIKDNQSTTIDFRATCVTDAIRFRIGGTLDDKRVGKDFRSAMSIDPNVRRYSGIKRGYPYAQEIELYGLVDADPRQPERRIASELDTQPDETEIPDPEF